jgi:hypothetical protein
LTHPFSCSQVRPLSRLIRAVPFTSLPKKRDSDFAAVATNFPGSPRMKGPSTDLFVELIFLLYKVKNVPMVSASFQVPQLAPLVTGRLGA